MAYIGRDVDKISNIEKLDVITFDGSSSYTLQKNSVNFVPNSANSLQVSIDGVVQAGNFTVSGSTIDFGVAIPATSTCDFIFHYGTGLITTPADGTVGLAQLSATGTKDSTTFLRGDNTFASAGGTNTPAFAAKTVSATWSNNSNVKITFTAEDYDTASAYDTSTGKFTVPSGEAGKYYLKASLYLTANANSELRQSSIMLYKNGSKIKEKQNNHDNNPQHRFTLDVSAVLDLSASDYIEVYGKVEDSSGTPGILTGAEYNYFEGFKLIE